MIRHFVVSRINLRRPDVPDSSRSGFSTKILDRMLRRSLRFQTCQDFTFLSLWDGNPEGTLLPNETPLSIPPSPDQFHEVFPTLAQSIGKQGVPALVTRVDSDDALATDAIGILQVSALACLALDLPFYLDAEKVWQYRELDSTMFLRKLKDGYITPFVSVLCPPNNLSAVDTMMREHCHTWRGCRGGMRVPGLRALQFIHGKNIVNRVKVDSEPSSVELHEFLGNVTAS